MLYAFSDLHFINRVSNGPSFLSQFNILDSLIAFKKYTYSNITRYMYNHSIILFIIIYSMKDER